MPPRARDSASRWAERSRPVDQVGVSPARVASPSIRNALRHHRKNDAVADRYPGAEVIIPPPATAVPNEMTTTQRDRHIAMIEKHGRMGWQRRSGYNRRSLVETAIYRYKTIISLRLPSPDSAKSTDRGKDRMQRGARTAWSRHLSAGLGISGFERRPACVNRRRRGTLGKLGLPQVLGSPRHAGIFQACL